MPRPKSCSRPNSWPTCTSKPNPIKRPNNKGHAQKNPIGLHSRCPNPHRLLTLYNEPKKM